MPLNPTIIDLILILIGIEFLGFLIGLARIGRRDLLPALACFLLSGAVIMLALRFALMDEVNPAWVLGLLGLSFPLHILTLVLAWRLTRRRL
jgi:chromate transport protein ChrA